MLPPNGNWAVSIRMFRWALVALPDGELEWQMLEPIDQTSPDEEAYVQQT
jgi:hypothetical protein